MDVQLDSKFNTYFLNGQRSREKQGTNTNMRAKGFIYNIGLHIYSQVRFKLIWGLFRVK